jgi:transcriptional regulator with XRE-family HTH domain
VKLYRAHFGRKLKAALKAAGLNQRQLAEDRRINVDPSAVSKWINGEDMPADDRFPSICAVLKVDEHYFEVDGSNPDFSASADFLTKLSSAPPDIQKLVLAIVRRDVAPLRTTSKDFQQKAIVFLKAILAF